MQHLVLAVALALLPAVAAAAQDAPAKPAKAAVKPGAKKKPTKAELDAQKAADEAAAAAAEAQRQAEAQAAEQAAQEASKQKEAEAAAAVQQQQEQQAQTQAVRGLQARVRVLSDRLAIDLKRLPGDHLDQRFAVVPLAEVGAEVQERKLGLVVSDLVMTNLVRDHRLPLVERAALGKVLDEQALGQSGAVDDKTAAALGELTGATALVVGQVSDAGDAFTVSLRAVGLDGVVLGAHDASLPKDELLAFSENAVVLRSKSAALFRSLVLPGWGQSYNNEPVKAVLTGSAVGGLAIATLGTFGLSGYLFNEYNRVAPGAPGYEDKTADEVGPIAANLREATNISLTTGLVLAGVTGGAWVLNAADAYLSGTDIESLDAALATGR